MLGEARGKTEAQGRHSSSSSSSEADSRQRAHEKRRDANKKAETKGQRGEAASGSATGPRRTRNSWREPVKEGRGARGSGRRLQRLGAVTAPGSARQGSGGARPGHARSGGARASPPHTHRWELRNGGGGGGGEPGGRARRSQSPPPASFEPAPKTAEGMGCGEGAANDRPRRPRSMREPVANPGAVAHADAGALGRRGRTARETLPLLPQVQTKQGRERARQRAPEEASARGAGG